VCRSWDEMTGSVLKAMLQYSSWRRMKRRVNDCLLNSAGMLQLRAASEMVRWRSVIDAAVGRLSR
jgi:hypothetical protein